MNSRRFFVASVLWAVAGCSGLTPTADVRVLIFGEQHDQPDQQRQVAEAVRGLATQSRLHAVVLEMADEGTTTALPQDADEATARTALRWNEAGWPWAQYGPVVMAAVRAGVPVLGGNLPRARMREAMGQTALDASVSATVRAQLTEAVREGHCGLMPESQMLPMVRIQLARDQAMARTVASALTTAPAGGQVLLLTGSQHASRDQGVPLHLAALGVDAKAVRVVMFGSAAGLLADERRPAVVTVTPDPCEGLRQRLQSPPAASAPKS
jgi:uncharacterized iron-regulated protein